MPSASFSRRAIHLYIQDCQQSKVSAGNMQCLLKHKQQRGIYMACKETCLSSCFSNQDNSYLVKFVGERALSSCFSNQDNSYLVSFVVERALLPLL